MEHYQTALELYKTMSNTEKSQAICLNNMGSMLNSIGQHKEALEYYDLALEILSASSNNADAFFAGCLGGKASALVDLELHSEAWPVLLESLSIYSAIPGTEDQRAKGIAILGNILAKQGQHEEALKKYEEAYSLSDEPSVRANLLFNIGICFQHSEDYDNALRSFEESLAMYSSIPGTEEDRADCMNGMGYALNQLSRYSEALRILHAASELYEGVLPNSKKSLSGCMVNISNVLIGLCRFEEAIEKAKIALGLCNDCHDANNLQAAAYLNISVALANTGHYSESIMFSEKALNTYKTLPQMIKEQALCFATMAPSLYCLGRYMEALEHQESALKLYQNLPNTKKDQAMCLNNIGAALNDLQRHAEAMERFEQTLALYQNLPNTEKDQAMCLNNIGTALNDLRRYAEAMERFEQALALYQNLLNTEKDQAMCLNNMGNALRGVGRNTDALEHYEQALALYQNLPNMEKGLADCLSNMGITHGALNVWPEALRYLYQGFTGAWHYSVPVLPVLTETQKNLFLSAQLQHSDPIYTVSLRHTTEVTDAGKYGLDVALMRKGLVEWAMQQEQVVFFEQAPEDWRKEYEKLQEWHREKAALAHGLEDGLHRLGEQDTPEAREVRVQRLTALNEQITAREQDLARRNAAFAAEMRLRVVDTELVSEALSTLGNSTALLEYVKYNETDFVHGEAGADRYGVYILPAGSNSPVGIDLGPAQAIDEAIAAFRGAIAAMPSFLGKNKKYPDRVQSQHMTAQHAKAGQTLRALIFDPVLPYVGTGTQLFVAPDAELFLLPFEALPSPNQSESETRYLVEDYGFVYLNSGREVLRLVDRPQVGTKNNTAVIVSDPDVRMPDTERSVQLVRWLEALPHGDEKITLAQRPPSPAALPPGILGGAVLGPNTEATLGSLLAGLNMIPCADTFTEELFEWLTQSRRFDSVTVVQREEALEECVQSLDGPRLLQILSHGVFLPMTEREAEGDSLLISTDASGHREIENPLLRSMLALAGASVSTSGDIYRLGERHFTEEEWLALDPSEREGDYTVIPLNDGRLTAYEVTGLPLYTTELVALTACSTALGDVGAGASVAGLRRAFTAAGAHSMIMAQWDVPVMPSMDQMKYFYEAWLGGGQGRYEAFRKSQLKVLADARNIKEFAGHPWFWAGFIYIGDPGAVRTE